MQNRRTENFTNIPPAISGTSQRDTAIAKGEESVHHSAMSTKRVNPYQGNDTFGTLERQRIFSKPSKGASEYPALQELVEPHINSFNALFEGVEGTKGLLDLAIADLPPKVIFDGREGKESSWGNKLECRRALLHPHRPNSFPLYSEGHGSQHCKAHDLREGQRRPRSQVLSLRGKLSSGPSKTIDHRMSRLVKDSPHTSPK